MPPSKLACSIASRKSWADPVIRAKRIAGIRRAKELNPHNAKAKLLENPTHLGYNVEVEVYDQIYKVAKKRGCTIAAVCRAYMEAGLHADKDLLNE